MDFLRLSPPLFNTWVGKIISQSGVTYGFDIDCDSFENSVIVEAEEISRKAPQHTKNKPWDNEVVAKELFYELHSADNQQLHEERKKRAL
jgi:hypothetical protein